MSEKIGGVNRFWLVLILMVICFIGLVLRYKVAGSEAVRPLFRVTLGAMSMMAIVMSLRIFKLNYVINRIFVVFMLLVGYLVIQGGGGDYRSFVDSLYISANLIVIFVLALWVVNHMRPMEVQTIFSMFLVVVVFMVVTSAVVSWIFLLPFYGFYDDLVSGDISFTLPFLQSPTYLHRMHGVFGDPTALGVFCAFAAILVLCISDPKRLILYRLMLISLFLSLLGLIGSGSRMGLIAFGVMLLIVVRYEHKRLYVVFFAFALATISYYSLSAVRNLIHGDHFYSSVSKTESSPKNNSENYGGAVSPALKMSTDVVNRYGKKILRISESSSYSERAMRLRGGVEKLLDTSVGGLFFGCGVECVHRYAFNSFNGYLDVLNNHGVIFFIFYLYFIYLIIGALLRVPNKLLRGSSVAVFVGVLCVELFGYFVFSTFVSIVQVLFVCCAVVAFVHENNHKYSV